jgi:hypothetical protein
VRNKLKKTQDELSKAQKIKTDKQSNDVNEKEKMYEEIKKYKKKASTLK